MARKKASGEQISMKCPYCANPGSKVVDKRETPDLLLTRRRRECLKCKKRYTTFEGVEEVGTLVVKKDGTREPFSRGKVLKGIVLACEKRPISREKIEQAVQEIESELRRKNKAEIPSADIGKMVMERLVKLDKVAYIRFASVCREFKGLSSFEREIKAIGGVKE